MCRCKLQFRMELSARGQSICKSTLTIDHICGITAYCKRRTVNAIWKSLPIGQPEKRCNALTGTTQSERILGSDRLKRSRLFFFFSSLSKYFYYHVKFISFISISMKNILFSCQPHRQWTKWNFVKNFVTCIVYILIFRYKFKISCLEQFCKKVLQFSVYNLSFFIYESNSSFITISQQWMIEWLLKIRFLHQS